MHIVEGRDSRTGKTWFLDEHFDTAEAANSRAIERSIMEGRYTDGPVYVSYRAVEKDKIE